MNTLKVVVAVFVRVVQLVANIACFVISLLRSREYNYLTLTVTSLNFIYNIYILVVVPLMNHKAYNGILFAIEIFFIVVYPIFSGIQTIIRPITTYWNYYSSDLYTIIASFVGFFCAATFLVSYILFVCWGVIPIVRHHGFRRFFEKQSFRFGCMVFDTELAEYSSKDFEEFSYSEEEYMASKNVSRKQNAYPPRQ